MGEQSPTIIHQLFTIMKAFFFFIFLAAAFLILTKNMEMEYYRVKPEYDNFSRTDGSILVKNELYTRREVERYKIPAERIERVNVKSGDVYWMFGARFSVNHPYSS